MNIIFEDNDIIAVNKPPHMLVHPGGKTFTQPAMTELLKVQLGYPVYPLYRLDRETTGIVIFAKNNEKVYSVFKSLKNKIYLALLEGHLKEETTVDVPIGEIKGEHVDYKQGPLDYGKKATTIFIPLEYKDNQTKVEVHLLTGRRHQIRVHAQYINHPVVNDKLYGKSDKLMKDFLEHPTDEHHLLHMSSITYKKQVITAPAPF